MRNQDLFPHRPDIRFDPPKRVLDSRHGVFGVSCPALSICEIVEGGNSVFVAVVLLGYPDVRAVGCDGLDEADAVEVEVVDVGVCGEEAGGEVAD